MTDSAFRKLTDAEQAFKTLVWDTGIAFGEKYLETQVPFFSLPVIKQMEEETIKLVTDAIWNSIVMFLDLSAISFVNAAHQAEYERASLKLRIILKEKGMNSPEFQKAKEEDAKAFADFVRYGATT